MGTRTNIIIRIPEYTKVLNYKLPNGEFASRTMPEEEIILYRHWDGYPQETGADLVWLMDALQRWPAESFPNAEVIRRTLFALSTHRQLQRRVTSNAQSITWDYQSYEVTDQLHGDIEYLYTLTYKPKWTSNPEVSLEIQERDYSKGWDSPIADCFSHLRTIKLKKALPSEDAFKSYLTPCGHYDHVYAWVADGEEAYSHVEVKA